MTVRKWPDRNLWLWAQYPYDWATIRHHAATIPTEAERWTLRGRSLILNNISDDDLFDMGAALRAAADMKNEISTHLPAVAMRARSEGYSWSAIGAALGQSRKAAWKRFHNAEYVNVSSEPFKLADLREAEKLTTAVDTVLRDMVVQAKCNTWTWGDPYELEEGMTWSEIADSLGKSVSATHGRYGTGLTLKRYHQLDEELKWELELSPFEGEHDEWFRCLIESRRHMAQP